VTPKGVPQHARVPIPGVCLVDGLDQKVLSFESMKNARISRHRLLGIHQHCAELGAERIDDRGTQQEPQNVRRLGFKDLLDQERFDVALR
jgi:hypothetical protein